jgi:hypothetical protein
MTSSSGFIGGTFLLLLKLNPHQGVCLAGSGGLGQPVKYV